MIANLFCRICGYEHSNSPWGADGQSPEYDSCPCCGVEAGNEDYALDSIRDYRRAWLADGASWLFSNERPASWLFPNERPAAWDLGQQMENIPAQYR